MTRRTSFIIQTNGDNIKCESLGQGENKKWIGGINLYKDGFFHITLASSDPIFGSEAKAIESMKEIVMKLRCKN